MLNVNRIKLYLEETPGKSITGMARHMGVAINTARTRIDSVDCMLSELVKIQEYTGLPYSELTTIPLGSDTGTVQDTASKYEIIARIKKDTETYMGPDAAHLKPEQIKMTAEQTELMPPDLSVSLP